MEIKITVKENRQMICSGYIIGTIGENNVTTLSFSFPKEIESWQHFLIADVKGDSYVLPIENETLLLPAYVLTASCFKAQVVATKDSGEKWISSPCRFILFPRINDSGENVIDTAKAEQREADRTELAGVVTDLTGEDLTAAEWDELMGFTAELPVKTEQDVIDLRKCSELTYAFEHATTPPSLLTGEYKLDKEEPDVPESAEVLIKLPYLNTRNVTNFGPATPISNSIEECSFDISSSPGANERYNVGMFQKGRANLRKLGLTGVEHINSLNSMFNNSPVLEEIALYVDGEFIVPVEGYRDVFYNDAFVGCRRLKSIVGDPLDMSVTTSYSSTFKFCESLQYVRFKPKTINGNLDLSDCSKLMKGKYGANTDDPGTLLSIVNGVREYNSGMGQITIKLSAFVKDYLTSWRCVKKDDETGLYIASTQGMTLATVLTNYKGVIIA